MGAEACTAIRRGTAISAALVACAILGGFAHGRSGGLPAREAKGAPLREEEEDMEELEVLTARGGVDELEYSWSSLDME